MFKALLIPFIWLDAFFQKRFDSVCFFLMRRFGWRKSGIRYAFYALAIIGLAAEHLMAFVWGLRDPGAFLMSIAVIFVFGWQQHRMKQNDEAAEARPGTSSQADIPDNNSISRAFKIIVALMIILDVITFGYALEWQTKLGWTGGQTRFVDAGALAFWVAMLLLEYLRRTPMNPPPESARESILVPAPAKL